jgi:hypothetical protein
LASFVLQPLLERLGANLPPPLLLDLRALVLLARLMRLLAEELVEALQSKAWDLACLDRGAHGATGLGAVLAVTKPAAGRSLLDVRERTPPGRPNPTTAARMPGMSMSRRARAT